jgi:peptidoglycan/LPS O-acetylase OafA/YrhL
MRRRRLALAPLVLLAAVTYGSVLSQYWPGSGVEPGLYGYAPTVLLATVLGCGVAAVADGRVETRRQVVRIAWYPGLAVVARLPLYLVLVVRGTPVEPYPTYNLVLGGVAGVGREIQRW